MHKYGQKANNFSKTITFHNSYVEKLVIAWLYGHLGRSIAAAITLQNSIPSNTRNIGASSALLAGPKMHTANK